MKITKTAILWIFLCVVACSEKTSESTIGNPCEVNIKVNDEIEEREYSIHTGPIDCEEEPQESNSVCVTINDPPNDEIENIISKSFCSCRCKNAYGQDHKEDESLCVCPGDSVCYEIAKQEDPDAPIDKLVEDILGSYCVPGCFINDCETQCEKSTSTNNSWDWECN